ncbi:SET domain [Phytophthora cactorum]|nr:SET domain [Phytophthora cactorum]
MAIHYIIPGAEIGCAGLNALRNVPAGRAVQQSSVGFFESTPAKVEVRDTVRTGAGLFALEPVSKGTLVCEYLGEIIDELEKGEREKAGDCEYASNKFIDAKYFGNIARYCNHSCNPNCIAEEWTVQGVYRIGISALKNIRLGQEITFNYGEGYTVNPCRCLVCSPMKARI